MKSSQIILLLLALLAGDRVSGFVSFFKDDDGRPWPCMGVSQYLDTAYCADLMYETYGNGKLTGDAYCQHKIDRYECVIEGICMVCSPEEAIKFDGYWRSDTKKYLAIRDRCVNYTMPLNLDEHYCDSHNITNYYVPKLAPPRRRATHPIPIRPIDHLYELFIMLLIVVCLFIIVYNCVRLVNYMCKNKKKRRQQSAVIDNSEDGAEMFEMVELGEHDELV